MANHKRPARRRGGSDDSIESGPNGEVVVEHQSAKKPSLPQVGEEEEESGVAAIRVPPKPLALPKRAARSKKKPTAKKNPPPSPVAHKTKRAKSPQPKAELHPTKSTKRKSRKVPSDEVQIEDGGAENGSGHTQGRSFDEMCEIYPRLARELKLLTDQHPALQSFFTGLDDKTAHLMEKELEEVGWTQLMLETQMGMEVQVPRAELKKNIVNMFLKVSKNASRR